MPPFVPMPPLHFADHVNFLAHVFLADHTPALRVGGLVGDFVKGPLPAGLPADLARGVALHRAIDAFAEGHPAFRTSRARVSPVRRRWAGVLVDIYYDHLLARDWPAWHATSLADFTAAVYAEGHARLAELPADCAWILPRMREQDWLGAYANLAGIALTLRRMAARVKRENPLAGAEEELLADAAGFAADCTAFLADARDFARDWINGPARR